jgi:hypothetical protein
MATSPTRGTRTTRTTRVPVTERNILSVKGKEPGYEYRIVNDSGDRVQQLVDAGYEFVDASTVQVGDKRINSTTPEGTHAQVSVGGGMKAYVMRIREDWYKEDQIAKQARVNEMEDTIKQNATGFDGNVTIKRGG